MGITRGFMLDDALGFFAYRFRSDVNECFVRRRIVAV